MSRYACTLLFLVFFGASMVPLAAQGYPSRAVTIVAPAPAGMKPEVGAKINEEVVALFTDPGFKKIYLDRCLFPSIAGTPQELISFISVQGPNWRKIVADAKIKVQR